MGRHRNYALGGQPAPEAKDAMLSLPFTLTSADLLALHTSPKTIVAAPGAQRVLVPIALAAGLHFLLTPFATGGDIDLYTGNPGIGYNWGAVMPSFFVEAGSDQDAQQVGMPNSYRQDITVHVENQPLILRSAADYTAGDGSITGVILYAICFIP